MKVTIEWWEKNYENTQPTALLINVCNISYAIKQEAVTECYVTLSLEIEENVDTQDALVSDYLVKLVENSCNEGSEKFMPKNVEMNETTPQPVPSRQRMKHFDVLEDVAEDSQAQSAPF